MATKKATAAAKTESTPAPAPANTAAPNMELLKFVCDSTLTEQGYGLAAPADLAPLELAGYVITNSAVTHENMIAAKATEEGMKANGKHQDDLAFQNQPAPQTAPTPAWGVPPAAPSATETVTATAAVAPSAPVGGYVIKERPIPPRTREAFGGAREPKYPFDQLQPGQSFFIPATKADPKPWASKGSAASANTKRFASEIPGQFVTNRKGRQVPKLAYTRIFKIYKHYEEQEDGSKVLGAAVHRVDGTAAAPTAAELASE